MREKAECAVLGRKDQMTCRVYGGYYNYDITYDAIGNLTSYAGWTYTWAQGRRLVKQVQDSKTVEYDYDASGLRVRKKYNSTISDYTWAGGKLVHLKAGSQDMHFFYDAEGMPAMMLYNQTPYLYVRNLQGDIIALVDTSGTTVVEYKYDPWGKKEAVTGTLAASVGRYNPFRYRGYIFDEETMMYYLKDRYYYPELRRFISADSVVAKSHSLFGKNLYQYCWNNIVSYADDSGTWPFTVHGTTAYGISWSISIGVYTISQSVGLATDTTGNVAAFQSIVGLPPDMNADDIPAGGLMGAGSSVSVFYQVFPNITVDSLSAEGSNMGVSIGPWSIDSITLGDYLPNANEVSGIQVSLGKSLIGGEWIHFGNSYTKVVEIIHRKNWTSEAEQVFKEINDAFSKFVNSYVQNLKKMLGLK